jgi:hypothetical protein
VKTKIANRKTGGGGGGTRAIGENLSFVVEEGLGRLRWVRRPDERARGRGGAGY